MQQIPLFPVPRGRPRLHQNNAEKQRVYRQKRAKDWAEAQAKLTQKAYLLSTKHDWGTPWDVFDAYNDEFAFTLDVCASAANRKCARYFAEADNGLAQDWGREICWMNPPYGRSLPLWMEKAYHSSLAGATVVCLVPARTGAGWWQTWVVGKAEIRYRAGRIRFVDSTHHATFDAAAVIYRP